MLPRQTEPNANNALGNLLRGMMPGCAVLSENTQTFPDYPGRHSDALITGPGRAPVVIEAEYEPAATVEQDARERLGLRVAAEQRAIEAAIAVRYPAAVEAAYDVTAALRSATLDYAVLYENGDRFPTAGWLHGSVTDLADLARLVSVPQREVDAAAEMMENGINGSAPVLDEMSKLKPSAAADVAALLGLPDVPQTRRMACAILANALVFHDRIAGMHPEVKPLRQLAAAPEPTRQDAVLDAWQSIIVDINYYPIFAIGRDILLTLPSADAAALLDRLRPTAQNVSGAGVDHAHDLTGRMFQRLIADRKYLATFYTRPESAALLARLAVAKLEGVDWADASAIGSLRIADFACGTGALLSAVYNQIAARHERAGGDLAQLHPLMMEEVLYGCDVMPAAVHITGSTLSGAQPSVKFDKSRLYTIPYGRLSDDSVAIGSLEFLNSNSQMTLSNFSDPALRVNGNGGEKEAHAVAEIPEEGFDLVIMNPPFTRAGSDWEGSARDEDAIKQFRGLSTDLETQREMSDREKRLTTGTCAHGYAGIASSFAALANRKLKKGGALALVLPLAAAAGASWQLFREMLAEHYTDLSVVSITSGGREVSFSADTAIAECLVVARKLRKGETGDNRVKFVSLTRRPQQFAGAAATAVNISDAGPVRGLEDGPYGGTNLELGTELVGSILTAASSAEDDAWGGVRIADYSLAQTAYALADSRLWLPGSPAALELKVAPLSQVGSRGMHDMNIAGTSAAAPFTRTRPSPTATYPALWGHNARKETRMVCIPDAELQVKQGHEDRAAAVWATASRAHLTRDFTLGSQPLCAAFTERESVGGRAWPTVQFGDSRFDYAFVLWCNSSLGLLSFWWHSGRQQPGRSIVTVSKIESLPILDLRALTDAQLDTAQEIFEEFRDKDLLPAYLADADPNRALLDRRVICDLLGFDQSVYRGARLLSAKWCAEPSVHGGKARPPEAQLVV